MYEGVSILMLLDTVHVIFIGRYWDMHITNFRKLGHNESIVCLIDLILYVSLRPINNLSVIKGWVFLG